MSIKAAVIGVGYLGRHHARIYSEIEGVELVAVADTDQKKASEIAAAYGGKAAGDFRAAIDSADAISIVTPTSMHFDIAMQCLKAGKDVLLEKPITVTVDEADRLIAEAERGKKILQVGHLERYNPAIVEAAKYISNPVFLEAERLSPFLGRGIDVDITLDLMIHDIDIISSLLKGAAIKDIRAVGSSVMTNKIDTAKAWIDFNGGIPAMITASRVSDAKQRTLKVFQRDSILVVDYQGMSVKKHFKSNGAMASETVNVEKKEPLKMEIIDFMECVKQRRAPRVGGMDGRNALDVALKISNIIKGTGVLK